MSDDVTRAATILADHRRSIDNLDAILIHTLAERFRHTQEVGRLKAAHYLPAADPSRVAEQVARLQRMSEESGLDPAFAEKFLNFIVQEVIHHHEIIAENAAQTQP